VRVGRWDIFETGRVGRARVAGADGRAAKQLRPESVADGFGCGRGGGNGVALVVVRPDVVEVAACRRPVPYDVPRSFLSVAQVVPRHFPAGVLVSAVAASRSPATVSVRSVFSRISASFSGFSPRLLVGGDLGG
jgi:hypothetical protein